MQCEMVVLGCVCEAVRALGVAVLSCERCHHGVHVCVIWYLQLDASCVVRSAQGVACCVLSAFLLAPVAVAVHRHRAL